MTLPSRPRLESLERRDVPATLSVGPGKAYATIGAAVAAAGNNDTVNVFHQPGGYAETIDIAKNGLKLRAADAGVVITSPADVTPDEVGDAGFGTLGEAVIDVRASRVVIEGFTIDGSTNTDGELYAGVRVLDGGSATVKNNTITGLVTASDARFGIAVQVGTSRQAGNAGRGTADVKDNVIEDYLGAGVLVDGARAEADVKDNVITGRGADNGGVAQYGVQVSEGASADVRKNRIEDNTDAGLSGGVLLYRAGRTTVADNRVAGNEVGVWVFETDGGRCDRVRVKDNRVTESGFAGVLIDASSQIDVKDNCVADGAGEGFWVSASRRVRLEGNEASDNAGNGFLAEDSADTWLSCNGSWDNGGNGFEVRGGSGNTVAWSVARSNAGDGVLVKDAVCTSVIANLLACNGRAGVRLKGAVSTFVAFNAVRGNREASIVIGADAEQTVTLCNRVDTAIVRE